MKNVLILCSCYGKDTDANGVCVKNVARELIKQGYSVFVVSETDNLLIKHEVLEGVEIYYLLSSWFSRLSNKQNNNKNFFSKIKFKIVSMVRHVFTFFVYPNVSPFRSKQLKRLCQTIIDNHKIDLVLGTYRPFESIYATLSIKKKYMEEITAVVYHLDLLTCPNNTNCLINNYKKRKGNKIIKKELEICDRLLLPYSAKNANFNNEKILYLDFPLFIPDESKSYIENLFSKDVINISYIGSLDSQNRPPNYFIELIENIIIQNKKIILHIWGKVDQYTKDYISNKNRIVIYHGIANHEDVASILFSSDFILNVSNKITYNMIPSKIFQLFSIGTPIINLVNHENDQSLSYFNRNDRSISILCYLNNYENDRNALNNFILEYYSKIRKSVDQKIYYESTPEYIVTVLKNTLPYSI